MRDRKYQATYRKKHGDRIKKRLREYYLKNKVKISKYIKNHRINNIVVYKENQKRIRLLRINSWVEKNVILKDTNCEICNKIIYFKGHPRKETIHFDHKNENCTIKVNPSTFLQSKFANEKNIKLWEDSDFGLLCASCNKGLPTKNRIEWLKKALDYATKS